LEVTAEWAVLGTGSSRADLLDGEFTVEEASLPCDHGG
jgi:hypothetical protein